MIIMQKLMHWGPFSACDVRKTVINKHKTIFKIDFVVFLSFIQNANRYCLWKCNKFSYCICIQFLKFFLHCADFFHYKRRYIYCRWARNWCLSVPPIAMWTSSVKRKVQYISGRSIIWHQARCPHSPLGSETALLCILGKCNTYTQTQEMQKVVGTLPATTRKRKSFASAIGQTLSNTGKGQVLLKGTGGQTWARHVMAKKNWTSTRYKGFLRNFDTKFSP